MGSFTVVCEVIAVVGLTIMVVSCWNLRKARNLQGRVPLGSLGWPVVGETIEFVSSVNSSCPERFIDKRRDKCVACERNGAFQLLPFAGSGRGITPFTCPTCQMGDVITEDCEVYGKVFKSHLFGNKTIVSTDPEVNRYVMHSSFEAFIPFYPRSLTELVGESSILLINGSLQRRVHGLIGAFFKSPSLKAQVTTDMQVYLKELMHGWKDDQLVHIQDITKSMVFQILVKCLMGLEPGEKMQFMKHQFQVFISGIMSIPIKIPGSKFYRSLQAKKKMMKLVNDIIQEKRRNKCMCAPVDIINVLLSDGSNQLSDDLIADNVIDLMIPGEDSVPVLITLAIYYLSNCPMALQQLKEENMQLKQKKYLSGEDLQWMDYMTLSITQNVITETLRVGNIISGIMRKAVKEVEIKGQIIPKDWCVFTYFRSVHLDGDLYDDPFKFNPWRWKDKDVTASSSFTPFGGGQRLCPGIDLARLIASIFLHQLVTCIEWDAEEDHIVNFPTVKMKGRMPIKIARQ